MTPLIDDRRHVLATAVEDAPDAVCLYHENNGQLELVYANPAFERLTGRSTHDALENGFTLLDANATRTLIEHRWTVVATAIEHPDGGRRDVEVTAWIDPPDSPKRYATCIARDTTAQHDLEESLLDLSAALESSADMIVITERMTETVDWSIVYANAAFLEETGYSSDEAKGLPMRALFTHADQQTVERGRRAAFEGEEAHMEVKLARQDGSWFWSSWRGRPIVHTDPSLRRRVVSIRNIHERVGAEQRLSAHSLRLRRLHVVAASSGRSAEHQIEAILKFGTQAFALESSFAGSIVDGEFTWEHLVCGSGSNPHTSPHVRIGAQIPLAQMALRAAIDSGDVIAYEDVRASETLGPGSVHYDPGWRSYIAAPLVVRGHLYGGIGFVSQRVRPLAFDSDDIDLMRLIAALVASATERGIQERRLDSLAFYDVLTGLPNRVLLEDRIQQLMALARRSVRKFAVHALDLDHFKNINDSAGHRAGDEALRMITKRFVSVLRESDTLARTGGDEFVVLQPSIEGDGDAELLANRLIGALDEPLTIDGVPHQVGVSVGISILDRNGSDGQTLLHSADRALYLAKGAGRNRFAFAKAPG